MSKGKVKWFDDAKGYGFIAAEDGQDVFVHSKCISSAFTSLDEGDEVSFDIVEGKKGPSAANVERL